MSTKDILYMIILREGTKNLLYRGTFKKIIINTKLISFIHKNMLCHHLLQLSMSHFHELIMSFNRFVINIVQKIFLNIYGLEPLDFYFQIIELFK